MKTNYLKLATLFLALSTTFSCSKDDSTPKVTEEEKPATELTTEQSVELNNSNTHFINQMTDFSDILSDFEVPAFKGNAGPYYGPDICGIKPLGVLDSQSLSYKFEYNFTDDNCYLKDKKIYGKVIIYVNIYGQISINLERLITLIDDTSKNYNLVNLGSGGFNFFKSKDRTINRLYSDNSSFATRLYYLTKDSDLKSINSWKVYVSTNHRYNTFNFSTKIFNGYTLSSIRYYNEVRHIENYVENYLSIQGSDLKLIDNCSNKGFVSGELKIVNPKNDITVNFGDGTCDNNTRTIKTKKETVTIKVTEETPKTFTNDPTPVDLSNFPALPPVLPGPPPAEY